MTKSSGRAPLLLLLAFLATTSTAPGVDLIGYLPYWRMSGSYNANTLPAQLAMLDEVRYFGLTAAANGTIVPLGGSGNMTTHLNRIATIKAAIETMPEADRPRLNITLGGAEEAAAFAAIAPNATLRATFAQNIEALLDQTGAASVDIDWEHPSAGAERTSHYPALLKRIKEEIGPDRRVYATVDPTVIISNSVFNAPNAIDGVSLMTYDLGWWGNDPSNPNQGEHSLPEYVADATEAWTEPPGSPNDRPWVFGTWGNNVLEEKLGVGLPFYAHTVAQPDATYLYSELVAGGTTVDGNYYSYAGRTAWLPGPALAAERVQYAHEQGLQHIIIWELGQDLHPSDANSLLRAAFEAKQSLLGLAGDYNNDSVVDAADYIIWRSNESTTNPLPNDPHGGTIGDEQYNTWRANFGSTALGVGATAVVVPEPAAALLSSFLSLLWVFDRRRTCKVAAKLVS